MHKGDKFFDRDEVIKAYKSGRHRADSPNETLEKPVILEMLPDPSGKDILDLGCGDGMFGVELLDSGCQSYLGIEASHHMVALAQSNLHGTLGRVVHSKIEDWSYPAESFDLVISRLALHYVPNLDETFKNVNNTLRQDGQFVFSIIHPVITSCDRSREGGGIRQDWIVDDYFTTGSRKVRFMGKFVEQFHRTIEDIYKSLQDASFQIEQLRESRPRLEHFVDESLYARRKRIPLFLFLSGRKR